MKGLVWTRATLAAGLGFLVLEVVAAPPQQQASPPRSPPEPGEGTDALTGWLQSAAGHLGVDCVDLLTSHHDLEQTLRGATPCVVRGREDEFVLVLRAAGRGRLTVLAPDARRHVVSTSTLAEWVRTPHLEGERAAVRALLASAGVPPARRARAERAILDRRLVHKTIEGVWALRSSAHTSLWLRLRRTGIVRRLAGLGALHGLQVASELASVVLLGHAVLAGSFDPGFFAGWALLLATVAALQVTTLVRQGDLAVEISRHLRQDLMVGALHLDADVSRREGLGGLLGSSLEVELLFVTAFQGGFAAGHGLLELACAAALFVLGDHGALLIVMASGFTVLLAAVAASYARRRGVWASARLALTFDLIEKMVGHGTRVVQEPRQLRHRDEDDALASYAGASAAVDARANLLGALPRVFLLVSALLVTRVALGGATTPSVALLALGALVAVQAFSRVALGASHLTDARLAWQRLSPILAARTAPPVLGDAAARTAAGGVASSPVPLLELRGVRFRHPGRSDAALESCDLVVRAGDRLLLEGRSGSGKSTLASIAGGLLRPTSGLVLARGLDHATLGEEGWRHVVACAPQFHDNHVFAETFLFNLLSGRRWLPSAEDVQEAVAVCQELGLGPLLERMPAGLQQMVGDSGWQLSHGERSRLYLARALLQKSELLILDETFAALDPETYQLAVDCVQRRATAALAIVHR